MRVVVHTADWHLGKNRKYADYLDQQRLMLNAMLALLIDVLNKHRQDEIWFIMAGDIFDRNEDTYREEFVLPLVNMVYPLLDLRNRYENFKFFFIDGNHDRQPHDPTNPNSLASVLSPLINIMEGHIAVAQPKWIEKQKLLLVPFGQYQLDQVLKLLSQYPAEFLVMHECCAGITTDVGWKPPRNQTHYMDMGELIRQAPNLVGVFLGDIHRSQTLDPKGICWYSGSPITLDFGEKMPKGVLIHYFEKKDNWVRVGEPELRSLLEYEPKLKFHKQLGLIDDPDNIPIEALSKFQDQYLQFKVTAEVYAQVSRQLPQVFDSPHVTWDHSLETEVKEIKKEDTIEDIEDKDMLSYYKPLIEQWITDNGKELTKKEREDSLVRILKDFEARS